DPRMKRRLRAYDGGRGDWCVGGARGAAFRNRTSAITICGVQERRDVAANTVLQRSEAGVVAGAKQFLDRGLREILILPANVVRHVDVFDFLIEAERAEERRDQVAKA